MVKIFVVTTLLGTLYIGWLHNEEMFPRNLKKVNAPHEVYDNYSGHSPILFWGEFVDNDWQFYYQTTDNTIHRFLVI